MKKLLFLLLFIFSVTTAYAAFPIDYNEKYDIGLNDKTFTLNKNIVTVSVTRPVKPLKAFTLSYNFKESNISKVNLKSNMEMNMGLFKSQAIQKSPNLFTAELILTKCMSGRTKWYTEADIFYKDGSSEKLYIFYDVK